jgi:hypothetical protein
MSLFETLREAVPHAAIEALLESPISHLIGGFFALVAANIVATIIVSSCVLAIGLFAYLEVPARMIARKLRRRNTNKMTVLIARFDGDNAQDIRDRIKEQLNKVFGESFNRAFDVVDFPLTILMPDTGSEAESYLKATRKGRRWLSYTNADLMLWGRARHIPEQPTIYFLLPDRKPNYHNAFNSEKLNVSDMQVSAIEGIRVCPERSYGIA